MNDDDNIFNEDVRLPFGQSSEEEEYDSEEGYEEEGEVLLDALGE